MRIWNSLKKFGRNSKCDRYWCEKEIKKNWNSNWNSNWERKFHIKRKIKVKIEIGKVNEAKKCLETRIGSRSSVEMDGTNTQDILMSLSLCKDQLS